MAAERNCVAYGQEPDAPRLCFFQGAECPQWGGPQCEERMHHERRRAYREMRELAAGGDAVWASILEDIDGPDDLLGGRD